jgi:hypothetical protein
MKYIKQGDEGSLAGYPVLELTRRNLQALLDKLDDPLSQRMLGDPDHNIYVRAVEDNAHYKDRAPGAVYMPSTGETR